MRNYIVTILVLLICLLSGHEAYAKSVRIVASMPIQEQLNMPNSTYIINDEIDLKGNTITLPSSSVLRFKKGGSIKNGVLEGNRTKVKATRNNTFHNCVIKGNWNVDCAYSSMFDDDLDATLLLKNLSCLSPNIRLSSKRNYSINACEESIDAEFIGADGKEKPIIKFHTTDPNVSGIKIYGCKIRLRNLIVEDDYAPSNDSIYGKNNATLGNTIAILSRNGVVGQLTVENCDFRGSTSSSWVASSQTRNCFVKYCTFTGYMADHGVYCSMKAESFVVDNCSIKDVTHASGLFKVRTSDSLQLFSISNTTAHNFNGYLAMLSLLETPDAKIIFDHIKVTRDEGNHSVFYGFCMNDETKSLRGHGYNAGRISITHCDFGYGYDGNSIIYAGAGNRVCAREITYDHVETNESNFGGGMVDEIIVNNCTFNDCSGDKGIYISAKEITIKNSSLSNGKQTNCVFLINYDKDYTNAIVLDKTNISFKTNTVFDVRKGNLLNVNLSKCRILKSSGPIIKSTDQAEVNYIEKGSVFF
ncbi:MAG: hypothetical protein IJ524_07275 [Bacteroidales bacterium]|nr:hypothetical protein [Bacteroidales bacterium]